MRTPRSDAAGPDPAAGVPANGNANGNGNGENGVRVRLDALSQPIRDRLEDPISKVSTYAYVNPVVAVLLGWAFLGEAVTARLAIGGITILAGLLLVYVARVREAGTAAPVSSRAPVEG